MFNALVDNRDDHLRNNGFLLEPGGWVLSPAFDLNPSPDKDVHVLALDDADPPGFPRAGRVFFRLDAGQASSIVEEIRRAVRPWDSQARSSGARRQELSLLGAVIDPER